MENLLAPTNVEQSNGYLFEERFKQACNWSKKQWQEEGLDGSRFNTVINSANYWRKKLREGFTKLNVILAIYNEEKDMYYTAIEIVDYIMDLYPDIEITSYNKFRNRRFLAIDFENEDMKEFVLNNFRTLHNSYVYFLSWAPLEEDIEVRIHWLPKEIGSDSVVAKLACYMNIKEVKSEARVHKNGKTVGNGAILATGSLKEKVELDIIPHIMYVGNLEVLIVVTGRAPLCLSCNQIGHRAYECTFMFCKKCRVFKPKGHICLNLREAENTYASVLTGGVSTEDKEATELWREDLSKVSLKDFTGDPVALESIVNDSKAKDGKNVVDVDNKDGEWITVNKNNSSKGKLTPLQEKSCVVEVKNSHRVLKEVDDDTMDVEALAVKRKLEENGDQSKVLRSENQESKVGRRMITRGQSKSRDNIYDNLKDEGGGESSN